MDLNELNIAVAEEMGWRFYCVNFHKESVYHGPNGEVASTAGLPPYSTSIDAIQKAAMERFKTGHEREEFEYQLFVVAYNKPASGKGYFSQLTAADWCLAFLETCKELAKK